MTGFFTPPGHDLMSQPEVSSYKAAGIAVIAMDTGRVLMQQRSLNHILCPQCDTEVHFDELDGWQHGDGSINCWDDSDSTAGEACGEPPDPNEGTWEFPGGKLDPGESPKTAAIREFQEEVGQELPSGLFVGFWESGSSVEEPVYKGFIYLIQSEDLIDLGNREIMNPDDPDGDRTEQSAWWDIEHAKENPALREEVKGVPWEEFEIWSDKSVRLSREVTSMFKDSSLEDYAKISEDGWVPFKDLAFEREVGDEQPPMWIREVQSPREGMTHHVLIEHNQPGDLQRGWVVRVGTINPKTDEFDYTHHSINNISSFSSLDQALAHSRVVDSGTPPRDSLQFSFAPREEEKDRTRPPGGSPPNKKASLDFEFDWIL